jgi:CheY-like chemotaxis protein/HPt (histidine-containing phosphotransfer) domain-containing protein
VDLAGRVLLAEDGPDNQQLILFVLQRAGLAAELARNGREAVEKAVEAWSHGHPYDLILMDMQMPELDGYSATRHLRAAGYTHPVIALTAHALNEERAACLAAGCDDFASKPLDLKALFATIRRHLPAAVRSPTLAAPASAPPPSAVHAAAPVSDAAMDRLVSQFVQRLPTRLADLTAALAAEDAARLRVLVHQLKGAAAGFGFARLTERSATLENALDTHAEVASLQAQLDGLVAECAAAIAQYASRSAP